MTSGWYHFSDMGSSEIIFIKGDEKEIDFGKASFGPFKTFSLCKKDAIDYHKTDIRAARLAVFEIKKLKKIDLIKEDKLKKVISD